MAIPKSKKVEVVSDIGQRLKEAGSVTFVAFDKLSVAEATDLRNSLRSAGVKYQVIKKTLLKLSLDDKFSGEMPPLNGNIAITWSDDEVASAREINNWRTAKKDRQEKAKIIGGIFESRYMSQKEMMEIALILDLTTLRGKFVNVINSPIQQLATVLLKIAEKKA